MGKTRLTIRDVKPEDRDHYRVEVLHSDGLQVFAIKEMNGVVMIEPKDDRVTLTTDMENVTKLTWKNFDVPLFDWTVSGLKFHTNNISVEAGSVAVNDALGKESYRVNVHSTANNTVQEEGRLESQPIGSITFHPKKMADKAQITWKKDVKAMDEDERIKYGPNGDLTIYNVTSEDKGKYTVQCGDRNLEQVFFLHL
ncbi:unnamed protein product [Staurois parvus]|uniref:Immunoglobulin I-set domain-containing protein n=1 Tax=Staurois parvus TaxID=386267 RepID=A0ABN9APP8_9NEOB|nr:unnamed protein product [Staurois parvus]